MQFSWKNSMNGSFYMYVLVPDAGPWAACQAAGGHLARLMQTVSRGLWGTCCPSGGRWGMEWDNSSTGDSTAWLTVQMCRQQWLSVACVPNKWASEFSPTDMIPDYNQTGCWESIRYMCRYIWKYLSLVGSVTQLLCYCYFDLEGTATVCDSVSSAPVGVGKPNVNF